MSQNPPPPPDMMCAVCRHKLTPFQPDRRTPFVTYLHPLGLGRFDHGPVPIRTQSENLVLVCDGCSTTGPMPWLATCTPFEVPSQDPEFSAFADDGTWILCEYCGSMVAAELWDKFTEHALSGIDKSKDRRRARQIHQAFRDHLLEIHRVGGDR